MKSQEQAINGFRQLLMQLADKEGLALRQAQAKAISEQNAARAVFWQHLEAFKASVEQAITNTLQQAGELDAADLEDFEFQLRGYARESVLDFLCGQYMGKD